MIDFVVICKPVAVDGVPDKCVFVEAESISDAVNYCHKHLPDCHVMRAMTAEQWAREQNTRNAPVSYRDNIVELIDRQREKGVKKYGQTLEQNTTLSTIQRIEHAQEELVDALQYLEHLKQAQTDKLTLNDYQRQVMRTLGGMDYSTTGENGLLQNCVMGLNGEAGEVIDIVKKHLFQGHDLDREHLQEELGDVLAYVAGCCSALGLTLEEVATGNTDKLNKRYPERFDKARSINREKEAEK